MGEDLRPDDMRAAVAIERREALGKPRKEDQVGASIVNRRPRVEGTGGTLELKLDRPLPDGAEVFTVTWQKESSPAELTSMRLAPDGAPVAELTLGTLPTDKTRRVQLSPRQDSLYVALDEVLAGWGNPTSEFATRLTLHSAIPQRLVLPTVAAAELAGNGTTWNAGQHRALVAALGQDLTYVWGPPGTGKTDLLAAVVEGAVRQGHRVLFAAPTKVAVDQALLRIASRLKGFDGFDRGLVQRWGKVELPALDEAYGPVVDRDRITARLARDLAEKRAELLGRRDQWVLLADKARERSRLTEQLDVLTRDRHATREQLDAAASSGPARWLKKVSGTPVPTQEEIPRLAATLEALQASTLKTGQALDALGPATPQEQSAGREVEELDAALAEIAREAGSQDRLIRETLRVAASTLDGAIQRRTEPGAFDTVVIDEAGMIPLLKAVTVASMASARVVLVGDFRQLPAVIATDSSSLTDPTEAALYRDWYERDVFDAAGLVSPEGKVVASAKLVALDTQYRMRPGICAMVNAVAYPDQPLHTGRGDTPRISSTVLTEPLVLVDSAVTGLSGPTSSTTFNPMHAALVREILRRLQSDETLPPRRSSDVTEGLVRDLGIIAPYRDQVKRLVAQVEERFGETPRGVVNTVHSFQGSERPVMLLDTVAHSGSRDLGWFYRGVDLGSTTTRLLNVALSRAQDHLIVIADVELLRAKADQNSATRRMIDHLCGHAQILQATDLVPTRSAAELRSLSPDESTIPAFFTADETPAGIEWDIDRARRQVEIYTPFISRATLRQRIANLKAATARGVEVTVWTRPTTAEQDPAAIADLRTVGVLVKTRDQMHEKLVTIDGEILWHGSYNYLAHTRATELMFRMVDDVAVDEARDTVQRAMPTRSASAWQPRTHGSTPQADGRVALQVPYAQKDEAKALGARWDRDRKTWWVHPEQLQSGQFDRWH